jgi:ABC-type multidrug transport system ATPase subunit
MTITRLRFETLTYGRPTEPSPALSELSFDFPVGGCFGLHGEAGSGKSSVLRILAGLETPSEGRYLINDEDITEMSFEDFAPLRRRIGYSFELGGLMSNRTIRQNLMLPFFYHRTLSADLAEARVNEYLARFRLETVRDQRPAQVPGGMRKACVVARALIHAPELLLLDQPTAGLDQRGESTLKELIKEHRWEKGLKHVFIVSEDEAFLKTLGCGHLELQNGKITLGHGAVAA